MVFRCHWIVVLLILCFKTNNAHQETPFDNVFGKLKSSFQLAGKLLGLDQTSSVANLVSEAFGKLSIKNQQEHEDKRTGNTEQPGRNNILSGFFRILGFDSKKIGAIGVNAIIFVAQLISSTLSLKPPSQIGEARSKIKDGSPLQWLLENPKVLELFSVIDDEKLPEHIVEYIKENSLDEETGCVQQLICKTSPFIWGMQKALNVGSNETIKIKKIRALFEYLPSIDEVAKNGDSCEDKHPYCFIGLT